MPCLDGRFVQLYRTYESGTATYCNLERRPRVRMVLCTVVSHVGSGRHTTYKVVTELTGGHEREIMLPVTEVQRQSLEKTRPEGRE